jgi:C-terminal processing protease CtpA/Prc
MKTLFYSLSLSVLFLISSCQTQDDLHVPKNLDSRNFVWKGMNLYYLWQDQVTNLNDNRFANQSELNNFLSQYDSPNSLFQSLKVPTTLDRFSVIFEDYNQLEGILSGKTLNNGLDFSLRFKNGSATEIFGWARYILPNSDAALKNVSRGTIFYAVNGTPLNTSNYQQLLNQTTYTLNLATYQNGIIIPNGQSVTLTKSSLSENPVYLAKSITLGNKKVGYLLYNGFYPNFETQLNQAIINLKAENCTDIVLDLRYNSGGSIATATRLASMLTGQFNNQIFAKEQWNDKLQVYWESNNPNQLVNNFTTSLNNGSSISGLNLSKLYILTSKSTASASELVINGLKPYIQIVQIGDVTTGKNVGSITLYDSPSFKKQGSSANHKYAMQPIVLKTTNKAGFGDYQQGLPADIYLQENLENLGILGEVSEPLLQKALQQISLGGKFKEKKTNSIFENLEFSNSKKMQPLQTEMYSDFK